MHALGRIQADCRLVHDQHRRVVEQGLRDAQALAHAAAEGAHTGAGHVLEVHRLQRLLDARAPFPPEPGEQRQVVKVLVGGQARVEAEVLGQEAQ